MTENETTENLIAPEEQISPEVLPETEDESREPRRKRNLSHIIMLSVLAALLIATIVLVALLSLPVGELEYPVIEIGDSDGAWEDGGTIAVFDKKLRPGSSGQYEFALKNPHGYELSYAFSLSPVFSDANGEYFPLKFRLRMNNIIVQTEEWRSIDELMFSEMYILPETTQTFTLEWSWPFEAGTDSKDTLLGAKGETVSMTLHISAQAR